MRWPRSRALASCSVQLKKLETTMQEPLVNLTTTFHHTGGGVPQCVLRIQTVNPDQDPHDMPPEFDFESLDPEHCIFLRLVLGCLIKCII
jgi:hypothetical protein